MKITNVKGHHEAFVRFAEKKFSRAPKKERISVTDLINPPFMRYLKLNFWDSLTYDVDDAVWAMFGQAFHHIISEAEVAGYAMEHEYETIIDGQRISTRLDSYNMLTETLEDFKVTKSYAIVFGVSKWTEYLNIVRYIMADKGIAVKHMNIIALLKDWDRFKAVRDTQYPQKDVQYIPVEIWNMSDVKDFILSRIKEHRKYSDGRAVCSDEEKWKKPTTYAVKKSQGTKAIKVHKTKEAADAHLKTANKKGKDIYYVEVRQGEYTNCEHYCFVRSICPFAEIIREQNGKTEVGQQA